jgi:Kef-type K+ transport system membrane component KefB
VGHLGDAPARPAGAGLNRVGGPSVNATGAAVPTLVVIAIGAVLAPLLAERTGRLRVPSVVLEITYGIIVGPAVLALAHPNDVVNSLSDLGIAMLMFLAGYELDLARVKGRPLQLASIGWVISLVLALGLAFALVRNGLAVDTVVIGLALTTTALGTLMPVLRDAGVLPTRFGPMVLAVGMIGEFGPIVAVALFLTSKHPAITGGLLALFVTIAVAAALVATRAHPPRVVALMRRHLNSSTQLPVRISVLLVLVLVYLALELGLDVLLGAFTAGIVVRLFVSGEDEPVIAGKLEALGFGFLVPIFFVVSGMHFDVHALRSPADLARIPLFLALMLVARGVPALALYGRDLGSTQRQALALFSGTGLPMIVVITSIGVADGRMLPVNAAALTAAGMLSVLIFPMIGLRLLQRSVAPEDVAPQGTGSTGPASALEEGDDGWAAEGL